MATSRRSPDELAADGWIRVSFSADTAEGGECSICGEQYEDCPCPGPTMEELYEYLVIDGAMWARMKREADRG